MSLPLSERGVQILANNRIRAALEAGEFANLPNAGQPIPDLDQPYDPDWWAKKAFNDNAVAEALKDLRAALDHSQPKI